MTRTEAEALSAGAVVFAVKHHLGGFDGAMARDPTLVQDSEAFPPWCVLLDKRGRAHELIRGSGLPDRTLCLHERECPAHLQPVDLRKFHLAPDQ
jgi:hypothetical protein